MSLTTVAVCQLTKLMMQMEYSQLTRRKGWVEYVCLLVVPDCSMDNLVTILTTHWLTKDKRKRNYGRLKATSEISENWDLQSQQSQWLFNKEWHETAFAILGMFWSQILQPMQCCRQCLVFPQSFVPCNVQSTNWSVQNAKCTVMYSVHCGCSCSCIFALI